MITQNNKGQSALEFLILIGFALILLASMLVVSQNILTGFENNKQERQILQIKNLLESEISFAQITPSYYERTFYVPARIDGYTYTLKSNDGVDFVIHYKSKQYVYFFNNLTLKNYEHLSTGVLTIYKNCSDVSCDIGLKD